MDCVVVVASVAKKSWNNGEDRFTMMIMVMMMMGGDDVTRHSTLQLAVEKPRRDESWQKGNMSLRLNGTGKRARKRELGACQVSCLSWEWTTWRIDILMN